MEKREDCWKRFERTGGVMDYLNYTACTKESFPDEDEVEEDDWNGHRERDGDSSSIR